MQTCAALDCLLYIFFIVMYTVPGIKKLSYCFALQPLLRQTLSGGCAFGAVCCVIGRCKVYSLCLSVCLPVCLSDSFSLSPSPNPYYHHLPVCLSTLCASLLAVRLSVSLSPLFVSQSFICLSLFTSPNPLSVGLSFSSFSRPLLPC